MNELKLYMLLLGCTPKGRRIEQHDIFFGIADSLRSLVPDIIQSWPGAGPLHIDAWREVTEVDGFSIQVLPRGSTHRDNAQKLFFVNLGGYKKGEFEEHHYKMLAVAPEKGEAVRLAKETAFYKHTGFKGAGSHIDDKYGIDVDDIYLIEDILPKALTEKYQLQINPSTTMHADEMNLGYTLISKII